MSWAVGFDTNWKRDIGYGVPAECDHPRCRTTIDRGLGCVCGGEALGGEAGCGLFFCGEHLSSVRVWGVRVAQLCSRCRNRKPPFAAKPDHLNWIRHKLSHESWAAWRQENPDEVKRLSLTGLAAIGS